MRKKYWSYDPSDGGCCPDPGGVEGDIIGDDDDRGSEPGEDIHINY